MSRQNQAAEAESKKNTNSKTSKGSSKLKKKTQSKTRKRSVVNNTIIINNADDGHISGGAKGAGEMSGKHPKLKG